MGGSFWQKDSLITHTLFELCLFRNLVKCTLFLLTLYDLSHAVFLKTWHYKMHNRKAFYHHVLQQYELICATQYLVLLTIRYTTHE